VLPRLLEAKADPNQTAPIKTPRGMHVVHCTPLDAAAKYNNQEIAAILISHNAVPSRKTKASAAVLKRKLKPLITASEQEKRRVLAEEKSAPARLTAFCKAHAEDLRALLRLYVEATDTVIRDEAAAEPWMLKVVSSEGNFATLKLRLGGTSFFLSLQMRPLKVINEFGMCVYEEET
jgi:hypothetical protein